MTSPFHKIDVSVSGTGVTLEQSPLGGPVVRLQNEFGTAIIAQQGAS